LTSSVSAQESIVDLPPGLFDLDKLIKICRENDAAMIGVFGSIARGDDTSASDIVLMVKFFKRKACYIL